MKCKEYETKSGKPIRLWNGDCMELMQGKAENHWDLAIVDPPYGIGVKSWDFTKPDRPNLTKKIKNGYTKHEHKEWDEAVPTEEYWTSLSNCSIDQNVFGANYFSNYLPPSRGWWVWNKGADYRESNNFSHAELVFTSYDKRLLTTPDISPKHGTRGGRDRIHPTEKPIRLYRWLLQNYAEEGNKILDTHGGSMSLAIACYIEDYELDIIELDEDYYRDAVQRFEQHISQQTLF